MPLLRAAVPLCLLEQSYRPGLALTQASRNVKCGLKGPLQKDLGLNNKPTARVSNTMAATSMRL